MSTSTWGELETQNDEVNSSSALLKHLLHQMMVQFGANGACIALYNESIDQMEIQLHARLHSIVAAGTRSSVNGETGSLLAHRISGNVATDSPVRLKRSSSAQVAEELDEVTPQQSELFPVGTCYPRKTGLIGYTWYKNEPYILRHDEYLAFLGANRQNSLQTESVPAYYLAVPISEPTLLEEADGKQKESQILGVVILYQTAPAVGFQSKQRLEALNFAERFALYLQNDQLRQRQQRTYDYLQRLQSISTAFPTTVKLSSLVEDVYQFASNIVDVSSMLLTFYDRDTKKIYDVLAVHNGKFVEGLSNWPTIMPPEERPLWWQITQEEKQTLLLDPAQLETSYYDELLTGSWGDQRKAESFLLLPMKMFTRVVGSLCLTSMQPKAYHAEEVQVLETMVQIITVSIENAKLYERARQSLNEAKQRTELLAAMNSTLQSISSVLNVAELMHKFVDSVALSVRAEMSVFFQLSPDKEELIAQAIYAPTRIWNDGSELPPPPSASLRNDEKHTELIEKIRLPFKGSILDNLVKEGFFYLDAQMAEEIAQASEEGGAIFLRETGIQKMLMLPVRYQTELVGLLAVHTPRQNRVFRPQEVGVLLAICGQAASAIRNAQLFEEIQEAYAELQRMDKLKDEFLVTASHELRTPLSAISGYSTLLKRQSDRISPQQILRFATKIAGSAQQLTDLVASMTDASKMGALDKKLDLQIGPVQVSSATEIAINMLSVNIEQKILSHVERDLWVKGDPLRVRQVITNLLDNAAKYSPPHGRIEIRASVTTLAQVHMPENLVDHASLVEHGSEPVVLVQVRDEGEGIFLEDQEKIFEKFVRAPRSLTTPVRGSGLGLYICRRYIEAMGGRLWLEQSIPGEGSVFRFYLLCEQMPQEIGEPDESAERFS